MNRAQQLVEQSFPELVTELISDILNECDSKRVQDEDSNDA